MRLRVKLVIAGAVVLWLVTASGSRLANYRGIQLLSVPAGPVPAERGLTTTTATPHFPSRSAFLYC